MARKSDDSQEVSAEELAEAGIDQKPAEAVEPAESAPSRTIDPAAFDALVATVETLEKRIQSLELRLRHTI